METEPGGYGYDDHAMSRMFESLSKITITNSTSGQSKPIDDVVFADGQGFQQESQDFGENQIFFNPSVCTQRYNRVREVLIQHLTESTDISLVTLIEFGCAELRLHQYLKNISERVQKLIYVDKDEFMLETAKPRIRPFTYEFLKKRETPLRVEVYSGCVTQCDPRILQCDPPTFAIIGIEIIEHLDPHILRGFERTIFGLLRPPMVILTTPNSEFNIIFNMTPGKFRHWDHRFEWTRAEFAQWCDRICQEYGGYTYEISGIGAGAPETAHLGCVSQMVVFRKIVVEVLTRDLDCFKDIILPSSYKLLAFENYPFFVDRTPRNVHIVNGFQSHIANYILNYTSVQDYRFDGKTEVTVPISIARYISGMPRDIEDLEEVRLALVEGGFNLQENPQSFAWEIVLRIPEDDEKNCFSNDEDNEMESEDNGIEEISENTPGYVAADSLQNDWDSEEW